MQLKLLKSKLHRASVTGAALDYHGSLTIDPELMEITGLVPFESILVSNLSNGARAETYVIPGIPGRRQIELNGAMARLGAVGDQLIIMSFVLLDREEVKEHEPIVLELGSQNRIESKTGTGTVAT